LCLHASVPKNGKWSYEEPHRLWALCSQENDRSQAQGTEEPQTAA
jgi:hypothetical protein